MAWEDGKRVYRHEPALTDGQERFARALAAGVPATEAARIAGYADANVAGHRLGRTEAVRARVRALRTNEIDKLASLSLRVLKDILRKQGVSDAVRLNAVKLSLALAGHTEKPSEEAKALKTKDIKDMSVDELTAFIHAETSKRAADAKPIIDHVSPQSDANPLKDNDISEKARPSEGHALLIEGSCELDDRARTDVVPDPGEP